MARRTSTAEPEDFEERILDIDVSDEMRTSYLEYAYSVIYARALPDARDGLKPVQRRILFSMAENNIRPDRSHVKCARVVGEVMGKYHPHGDGAIYDALVRTGQSWSMRVPLIDPHGNFGSLDDGPAAMRYTECRMAPPAMAMTAGLDENVVDFKPNYDGQENEPSVLPAAFPNLLVNGATGIAVGMATNMAPHNLVEVIQALRHLIKTPSADIDDLMRFVPGPDLPTGGKIVGLEGIKDAYATGRGSFKMRATARIENVTPRRKGIVVTELPYAVGPEKVIEKIKTLVQAKKLQGIADVKDLTDRTHGTQLVIEVKNGFVPEALLEQLYKLTPLEDAFHVNNVCLVEGQPRTLGLKQLLEVYLDHRYDVVRRRSEFRRKKAQDRLHIVEGMLIAILDIDEVIQIIRSSDDSAAARSRLIEIYDLSEIQANYILDMPLRRLTKYSKLELETEKGELEREIEALTAIIDDPKLLQKTVSDELAEIAKTYGTPRRTVLLESSGATKTAAVPLEVSDDPCWILMSSTGLLARTNGVEPFGGGDARAKHDAIVSAVKSTARGQYGLITSAGRLIRLESLDLPAVPTTAAAPNLQGGAPIAEFVSLEPGEKALALTTMDPDSVGVALGTTGGVVKRVLPDHLSNRDSWEIIGLKDGDEVIGAVELSTGEEELCFITSDAQLLHFPASAVRPQGRTAGGMAGVRLAAKAKVVFFGAVDAGREAQVVTIAGSSSALPGTEVGAVKVTPFSEYPGKGRGTGGVRCQRLLKGEDGLLLGFIGAAPVKASASSGAPVDLPPIDPRRDGSGVPVAQPIAACAADLAG
ncbi:DNA gyrase/topoisomerase IV subunit A [Kribbella jiaozuonensis]|uniref:DNA topoisomerase (ATP-hydrolyzing) n=1 Tax=Kribbella jiaozuonensis TaxID=2575441 RepID=A0A4U3LW22_9ACTN|nr:DNA topoisomerase IV subunit A [Kribbella jiaozuonensis]TKK80358.1 DNA topoisomerase IV subunit A [Kribbella jiaozuonensis]